MDSNQIYSRIGAEQAEILSDGDIENLLNINMIETTTAKDRSSSKRPKKQYQEAREVLLNDIVPKEENAKSSCLFRTCCCFYYAFCCCLFCEKSKVVTKQTFVKRFEKWLNLDNRRGDKALNVAKAMIRMYAHQPGAIQALEKCRINPDFRSVFRDDLEFYIPQLCSFYLKGNLEDPMALFNVMILASQTNFFFSHRVWFFFHSAMFQQFNQQIYESSHSILKALKTVCLQNADEKLYVANSSNIVKFIIQLYMSDFYPSIHSDNELQAKYYNTIKLSGDKKQKEKEKQIEKMVKVQKIIRKYAKHESVKLKKSFNTIMLEKTGIADNTDDIVITAQDIVLNQFVYSPDYKEHYDDQARQQNVPDEMRQKLESFLSTPRFIKCLTEIGTKISMMKEVTKIEKTQILKRELIWLNQHLPASVYIPFVQNSTRNYCVLHIPPDEARVFQTKERAPIMLAIEVFRPDEMAIILKRKKNKDLLKNLKSEMPDNPYIEEDKELEELSDSKSDQKILSPRRGFKNFFDKKSKVEQKIVNKVQKKADKSISKTLMIKKVKNKDIINKTKDDFNVTSIQSIEIQYNKQNFKKDDLRRKTTYFLQRSNGELKLEEDKKEDDFEIGVDQFLDFYTSQINQTRSKTDDNFLNDLSTFKEKMRTKSLQSDPDGQIRRDIKNSDQLNEMLLSPKNIVIEERESEGISSRSSRTGGTDSELGDSQNSVSSDEGVYQDLPIILDHGQANNIESEQGMPANLNSSQLINSSYGSRDNLNTSNSNKSQTQNSSKAAKKSKSKILSRNSFERETSKGQKIRIRDKSPFGNLKSWNLIRVIVKTIDDVRQEQFAMQLISQFNQIFKMKKLPLWLKTYEILATGPNCGLIEVINDVRTLDEIHKIGEGIQLLDYFVVHHGKGKIKSNRFKKAQKNYCFSLAAYSLVQYVLQIKDRHNQNIMVDAEGHIVHIDYGFLLSNAPGKGLKFEQAPFKLTTEYVAVLGGVRGKYYKLYRDLVKLGFLALQEHADKIIMLVEMMMLGQKDLPCFQDGEQTIAALKQRLFPNQKMMTEAQAKRFTEDLIVQSENNWRTNMYDKVQYCCQGIV